VVGKTNRGAVMEVEPNVDKFDEIFYKTWLCNFIAELVDNCDTPACYICARQGRSDHESGVSFICKPMTGPSRTQGLVTSLLYLDGHVWGILYCAHPGPHRF